ncbi:alpha/beta-hydrolase [Auriculariales sp. MPI-PUGE-AT-0066]|nr:alpha/beta-hydrolase [Auriculariales sp. MPI-PUGE-AT-0066]
MRLVGFAVAVVLASAQAARGALDAANWDRIRTHWKYATSAYQDTCTYPNGKVLLKTFSNNSTGVHGYIARDDTVQEFVVAFRGAPDSNITSTIKSNQTVTTLAIPGGPATGGTFEPRVHAGFLAKYNSVAKIIKDTLKAEVKKNPNKYSLYLVSSAGHNVGGALALLNSVALRYFDWSPETQNRPFTQAFAYGVPRMENDAWASLVSEVAGHYRVVHTNDGVPKMIARKDGQNGWMHPPLEYWAYKDPPSAKNTEKCRLYGNDNFFEDERCSVSVKTNEVNGAHFTYFGISYKTPFCKK